MDSVVQISITLIMAILVFIAGSIFLDSDYVYRRGLLEDESKGKGLTLWVYHHRGMIKLCLLGLITFLIYYITVLSRPVSCEARYVLTPFYSYALALKGNRYYTEEVILNILLYVPFGFLFAAAFKNLKLFWIWIAALLLSLSVELLQLYFHLGVFETDDIINNVLGGVVGSIFHWMGEHIKLRIKKKG
ncbi:MAG: VanZ family protein [Lachnospiraceae bacterium]|nr:VanZ family protein [Lachnospiraceae bacterium]